MGTLPATNDAGVRAFGWQEELVDVVKPPRTVHSDAVNRLEHVLWWHGDNQAEVAISHHGHSPALRHSGRTMRVDLSFIRDCINNGHVKHPYIGTKSMCADIFTKFFKQSRKSEWDSVRKNVNIYGQDETLRLAKEDLVMSRPQAARRKHQL